MRTSNTSKKPSNGKGRSEERRSNRKPEPGYAFNAEQTREASEADSARNAEASIRDRMVQIGRATRQSGRQRQDS